MKKRPALLPRRGAIPGLFPEVTESGTRHRPGHDGTLPESGGLPFFHTSAAQELFCRPFPVPVAPFPVKKHFSR